MSFGSSTFGKAKLGALLPRLVDELRKLDVSLKRLGNELRKLTIL